VYNCNSSWLLLLLYCHGTAVCSKIICWGMGNLLRVEKGEIFGKSTIPSHNKIIFLWKRYSCRLCCSCHPTSSVLHQSVACSRSEEERTKRGAPIISTVSRTWRMCKTNRRGLVKSSAGFVVLGILCRTMSPTPFQSSIGKCCILTCRDRSEKLYEDKSGSKREQG
jgi:hypothetical protein